MKQSATIKLYIHQLPGKPQRAETFDMSKYGYGAMLGTQDVEVEFDLIDKDPVLAMIENLESEVREVRADAQIKVNGLIDKISKLKCLEHKDGAA